MLSLLALVWASGLSAQHNISNDNIGQFASLNVSGNISVELIASDVNRVEVVLHDTDINKFKLTSNDNTLSLNLNNAGKSKGRADAKVFYADSLKRISVSVGQLHSRGMIKGLSLTLNASNGAAVNVEVDLFDLELTASGNSAVEVTGISEYLTVSGSSKSKVNAGGLDCMAVYAESASSAELTLWATDRLEVEAKSSGAIHYKVKPILLIDRTSKMNSGMMGSSVTYIGE